MNKQALIQIRSKARKIQSELARHAQEVHFNLTLAELEPYQKRIMAVSEELALMEELKSGELMFMFQDIVGVVAITSFTISGMRQHASSRTPLEQVAAADGRFEIEEGQYTFTRVPKK